MDLSRPLKVVTPTLDGDVLGVLAGGDAALTGREIQRRVGASQDGVRGALDRLTRQGVVRRERAGRANLYRLNRQHLAAPWIEGLASLRLQLIERLRDTIRSWELEPIAAVLFGSAARGEAGRESDLDILVVRPSDCLPDDPTWREQLMSLETSAAAWTGNDVRLLEYGEAEVPTGRDREPVLNAAFNEGIELFGSLRRLRSRREGARH
jgi:predicted nucleotidyltransferase